MRRPQGRCRWIWLGILGLALLLLGCEETPQTQLTDAKRALAAGEVDRAEDRLIAVLEVEPRSVEARRMMASVEMRRGEFESAEEILEQLWDDNGFAREGELNPRQRQTRQLVNEQFSKLYHHWVQSIDPAESPERFEEIARTGLKRNSRDSHLNSMMADFYEARAERLIEQNQLVLAAEHLERIDELHRFPDSRRDARERAQQLRRQAFFERATERFRRDIQPDLLAAENYDPDRQIVRIAVDPPVDHRLQPDQEGALEQARSSAVQSVMPTLTQLAASIGDLEYDQIDPVAAEVPELQIEEEQFRPGNYEATFALHLDSLLDLGFSHSEAVRRGGATPADSDDPDADDADNVDLHVEDAH